MKAKVRKIYYERITVSETEQALSCIAETIMQNINISNDSQEKKDPFEWCTIKKIIEYFIAHGNCVRNGFDDTLENKQIQLSYKLLYSDIEKLWLTIESESTRYLNNIKDTDLQFLAIAPYRTVKSAFKLLLMNLRIYKVTQL